MINFLDKILLRSNNLDFISQSIKDLTKKTPVSIIFNAINSYSSESEIRYVGGCIRKIINKEKVDDIDLATNLEPGEIIKALKKNNINYFETGISHGTVTAVIKDYKFEITTLRKDVSTDGRHAEVRFSKNWKEDALRRDFTINSIYSDKDGNLFDPLDGKKDLENGFLNFIGEPNTRIKEDYLRILRYIRFFLNYSKIKHNSEIIRKIKLNIYGIIKLSKERLLDELKKIAKVDILEKLSKDDIALNLILIVFPELKNIKIFSKLTLDQKELLKKSDFIFLLSLMIIDEADNADYFLYKFKVSKKEKERIKIINDFFREKVNKKTFIESNLNKVLYYHGREAVLDILNFRIIKLRKFDGNLIELKELFQNKLIPNMPVKADLLMDKYQIPEGKQLGAKLKIIEKQWVDNDFKISEQQVDNIVKN